MLNTYQRKSNEPLNLRVVGYLGIQTKTKLKNSLLMKSLFRSRVPKLKLSSNVFSKVTVIIFMYVLGN